MCLTFVSNFCVYCMTVTYSVLLNLQEHKIKQYSDCYDFFHILFHLMKPQISGDERWTCGVINNIIIINNNSNTVSVCSIILFSYFEV